MSMCGAQTQISFYRHKGMLSPQVCHTSECLRSVYVYLDLMMNFHCRYSIPSGRSDWPDNEACHTDSDIEICRTPL